MSGKQSIPRLLDLNGQSLSVTVASIDGEKLIGIK